MSLEHWLFWITVATAIDVYALLLLARRWPQLKSAAYVLNLIGLSFCGYTSIWAHPDPVWLGGLVLNFVFQNALLVGDRR